MRLQREIPTVAVGFQTLQNLLNIAVPIPCRNHAAILKYGILHMDLGDIGLQQFIRLQGILSRLHEVGKVKNRFEMFSRKTL